MAFPYQCLVARSESSADGAAWTLFGASGSKIVVQSSNGVASVWSQQAVQVLDPKDDDIQEPPGKRIKLSTPKEQKFNFSSLVLSNNGHYLVGVTGEDKCVRVFQIDAQSGLQQLSERCMSRRPSAIKLTSDDSTILCADKFGDVYALPLLPSPEDEQVEAPAPALPLEEKDFTPSATVFTVHSGRNRRTLEEQLKQKAKGPAKPKEAITFRHDLLLGHVSMLTDLAFAKIGNKSYIITADRDEHIRISRGVPQAHIIEGFCFGHEEFVSRLCVTRSGLLVSGGGDAHLLVWDWRNFLLNEKLPLRDTVIKHLRSRPDLSSSFKDDASFKTAVSGIWEVPGIKETSEVLVACEGLPGLFNFNVGTGAVNGDSLSLMGNPLDVAFVQTSPNSWTTIVSIDNVHKAGSTSELRENADGARLQYFSKQVDGAWREDAEMGALVSSFVLGGTDGPDLTTADDKAVRDILYHVENLRKRPGAED
ncbi:tRNA methyltransferase non-catalytic subunit TRM82 [Parastagonospora nodorum]|nr:tRNA methyltransferase non-catalytic subunit TRM82 [Parastagonospora nodorum]KAH4991897.1 tRNA methyltransferase non-catalytic subunit TRM82 [Parastagonospora nodorum]